MAQVTGFVGRLFVRRSPQCSFVRVCHSPLSDLLHLVSPPSKYECLLGRNVDNDGPEGPVQRTFFFGELQRVVRLDVRKEDRSILKPMQFRGFRKVKTYEATQNEDGFWEYSSMKPSPDLADLNTIACVVGGVFDPGR